MIKNSVNYSIISINNRSDDNKKDIRKKMQDFKEINVESVDGNKKNTNLLLKNLSLSTSKWNWAGKPRPGEIGVWLSNINIFNKIINDDIENLLVFEDDAILSDNFVEKLNELILEIPQDYDFLSLVFPSSSKIYYKKDADLSLKNICSAKYNHFCIIAMLWSKNGAKKMIESINKTNITYPIDLYIYDYLLKQNMINGYSIKPEINQIVFHDWDRYMSTIDIDGTRGGLDV